ncbi:LysR family transcriptional regulator [Photobacterium sp. SDRW27]|uniref:LysR family transcriptional regulator n=1 Tax=Photobacterium obscurum TaxID=2829490 RepID=UPI002243BA9E|nr:LysR family transcriptional regulator [Photobacterium obscurum]MCW8327191.1 LysR family transcriptional regulator [Photobacterium obscurum]
MDKLLQQFLLVARLQSVSAAAKMAGLSQPTVTSNLKKLEKNLEVSLFERKANGMVMTEFGQILYEHSSRMQHEYHQMMTRINERKQYLSGKIRIGTGDAWWTLFVKEAIHQHRHQFPSASVQIELGNHLSLMESLVNDQIAFFIGHEIIGLSSKYNVIFTPLFPTYDAYFVNPSHPLLSQVTTEAMLEEYPSITVTYDLDKYSHIIDDPFPKLVESHKQKLDERTVYEVDSLLASIDMAMDTCAVMPYPNAMTKYLSRFGLKPLNMDTPPFRGTVGIYQLPQKVSDEHNTLLDRIKCLASQHI